MNSVVSLETHAINWFASLMSTHKVLPGDTLFWGNITDEEAAKASFMFATRKLDALCDAGILYKHPDKREWHMTEKGMDLARLMYL